MLRTLVIHFAGNAFHHVFEEYCAGTEAGIEISFKKNVLRLSSLFKLYIGLEATTPDGFKPLLSTPKAV